VNKTKARETKVAERFPHCYIYILKIVNKSRQHRRSIRVCADNYETSSVVSESLFSLHLSLSMFHYADKTNILIPFVLLWHY